MRTPFGWLIGDPHLGKQFEVGVPLHRRGERERRQMALFRKELNTPNAAMIVMVGDLFDHPYVGYAVVKEAAEVTVEAAEHNPEVTYVFVAGNHDLPRNITRVGAFHAFERMVGNRLPNLHVLRQPRRIGSVVFFPWEWDRTAEEQVEDFVRDIDVRHCVGHWDLKSFGGADAHLAPVDALKAAFPAVEGFWSGHYHEEGDYNLAGDVVYCCGSLEPYSHGEDSEGSVYVTLSRDDVISAADELRDKCVRILLRPGEDVPDIDALSITVERVRYAEAEDTGLCFETLDWGSILAQKLAPLDPIVRAFITERLSTDDSSKEQC